MTKFRLGYIPCQNKESKEKKRANDVFSTRPFVLKRGRPR